MHESEKGRLHWKGTETAPPLIVDPQLVSMVTVEEPDLFSKAVS